MLVNYNVLYRVCNSDLIMDNTFKVFSIKTDNNDSPIDLLVGKKNNKLFAFDNYCPHRGASLSKGELSYDANRIVCYLHDFEYNIFSGKLEVIPDKWIDQSTEWKKSDDLTLYEMVEKEGDIFVDIP